MGEDVEQTKRLLRQRLLAARRDLPVAHAARFAAAVCGRVTRWQSFTASSHVVAYAPIQNEVDPGDVVAAALAGGKAVYYPRIAESGLEFMRADPTTLEPGRMGIAEPATGSPLLPGTSAVIFLVPGVAFDVRGARLGRGAGCYDRALARHPEAIRIGLAYEMQMVPSLPEEPSDVRMHAVATEARLIETGDARGEL